MNRLKIAFAGFRHDHIRSLYDLAREREDLEIVAACEEDGATRVRLEQSGKVDVTHTCLDSMLDVESNIIAVGEYFTKRGEVAIRALQSGRHVIVDKPLFARRWKRSNRWPFCQPSIRLRLAACSPCAIPHKRWGHDSSFKRDALAKYTPFPLVASTSLCSTHAQRGILKRASTEAP